MTAPRAARDPVTRTLSWSAVIGVGAATLLMLAVDAACPSRAVVRVPRPAAGPPWDLNLHPSSGLVTLALWIATIGGGAGVAAGIAAVSRGARPPVRWMVAAALTVTALFAVFPVAGLTDALDYASYGRMVVLGHNPYVTTPYQMRRLGDPVARLSPHPWLRDHSAYGPLASAEQAAAAALGGTSAARITFWLKLWTALAFGAVVLALDRLLRREPARRARAHLLWSLNPLLLWDSGGRGARGRARRGPRLLPPDMGGERRPAFHALRRGERDRRLLHHGDVHNRLAGPQAAGETIPHKPIVAKHMKMWNRCSTMLIFRWLTICCTVTTSLPGRTHRNAGRFTRGG